MDTKHTSPNTGSKSMTYSPKTGKEKDEAYKLLDDFLRELARGQALRGALVGNLSAQGQARKQKQKKSPTNTKPPPKSEAG